MRDAVLAQGSMAKVLALIQSTFKLSLSRRVSKKLNAKKKIVHIRACAHVCICVHLASLCMQTNLFSGCLVYSTLRSASMATYITLSLCLFTCV